MEQVYVFMGKNILEVDLCVCVFVYYLSVCTV